MAGYLNEFWREKSQTFGRINFLFIFDATRVKGQCGQIIAFIFLHHFLTSYNKENDFRSFYETKKGRGEKQRLFSIFRRLTRKVRGSVARRWEFLIFMGNKTRYLWPYGMLKIVYLFLNFSLIPTRDVVFKLGVSFNFLWLKLLESGTDQGQIES